MSIVHDREAEVNRIRPPDPSLFPGKGVRRGLTIGVDFLIIYATGNITISPQRNL